MAQLHIPIDMKVVCEVFDMPYNEDAVYAYGKVVGFAKCTNFVNKRGMMKDDRKKLRREKAKANAIMGGIEEDMSALDATGEATDMVLDFSNFKF